MKKVYKIVNNRGALIKDIPGLDIYYFHQGLSVCVDDPNDKCVKNHDGEMLSLTQFLYDNISPELKTEDPNEKSRFYVIYKDDSDKKVEDIKEVKVEEVKEAEVTEDEEATLKALEVAPEKPVAKVAKTPSKK